MSWPCSRPGFSSRTGRVLPTQDAVEGGLLGMDQGLNAGQPLGNHRVRHLVRVLGGGRSGARRIFEGIGAGVAHRFNEIQGVFKIRIRFTGKAHDEITRQRHVGPGAAHFCNGLQIIINAVAPVHGFQDTVAAALNRQMQEGHELRVAGMGLDQRFVHIPRVACGVTQALDTRNV